MLDQLVKPITLAIIGTRGHYKNVLREAFETPGVEIVAAPGGEGDGAGPIVAWWREHAGREPRVFDDHRRMFDEAAPDVAVVCGPLELHAATSIDAIQRGIHVLTEKPAALTLGDLDELRAVCERHPHVHLAAMMFSRYTPGFYTSWQLIEAGGIGDVRLMNARKSYKLGQRAAYYRDREAYGGTIPWVGSHAIDWVLWIGGHGVESVYASHSAAHNAGNGSLERAASCHLSLCGGRSGSISIDIFRPDTAPTHGDDWLRVVGTEGVMEVRPDSVQLINADNDGTRPVKVSCDRRPLQDFLAHTSGERKALIDSPATLELTEVCLLARQSADEQKVIRPSQRVSQCS